jgi:alanine dehydrogenase
MNIGIPKERRPFEFRVGLTPAGVEALCQNSHVVFVEHEAGLGAGYTDKEYENAGGRIAYSMEEVFGRADYLLKFARPTDQEMDLIQPNTTFLGYLYLASARQSKVDVLLKDKITSIAYEQIQEADGSLPVLRPLSQIGGAMAADVAALLLHSDQGGRGILMGGIPGVPPAEVVILGGGTVGSYAARACMGRGAHVTLLDKDINVLQRVSQFSGNILTLLSSQRNIEKSLGYADVVIGAVLVSGMRAPLLISREMVGKMKPRSVVIDMSIDQGGCFETSRPTTHANPTYVEEGVVHYCVPNMPGVVARTATNGFVNAALPYILDIINLGVDEAINRNPAIEFGITTYKGELRHLSRLTKK